MIKDTILNYLFSGGIEPVRNYVMPGLNSYLLSKAPNGAKLRAFHATRDHLMTITPHSHRFDLQCEVLRGRVYNELWVPDDDGDLFSVQEQVCDGMGEYELHDMGGGRYRRKNLRYNEGETYRMKHDEIHSIEFGRDSIVLIHESEPKSDRSVVLLPVLHCGTVVNTLDVKPWMFLRGKSNA